MSAYNLPPPWDAGYAVPANARAEGLQRRAITTEWAQRGTFDNPRVGSAGYALPAYVASEPYGQGARITKAAPRGTAPRIPHWIEDPTARVIRTAAAPGGAVKMQIQALAGLERQAAGAAPVSAYARKSAAALIETVKMMPASLRATKLRAMLAQVDPSLHGRAEALARAEEKAGVLPLVALERGLAAAMSVGLAEELVKIGRGGGAKRRGQVGAIMSLGADPGEGACSADGRYIFRSGAWARKLASDVCGSTSTAAGTVRTHEKKSVRAIPASSAFLKIGPFLIPMGAKVTWHSKTLTEEQVNWLRGGGVATMKAFSAAGWKPLNLRNVLNDGTFPLVKFTMPAGGPLEGKEYGLYMSGSFYEHGDYKMEWRPYSEPPKPEQKSWWKRAWGAIKRVVVKIVDAVKDAAAWVKNQGCKLMSSPDISQAVGAVAGMSIGGPVDAQAGAVGAQIVAKACAKKEPVVDAGDKADTGGGGMMPLLLIGGVGAAAFLYYRSKS